MYDVSGLQDGQHEHVGRKDALSAAPVKTREVVRFAFRVEENTRDQEAREDEEELDTFLAPGAQVYSCFRQTVESTQRGRPARP